MSDNENKPNDDSNKKSVSSDDATAGTLSQIKYQIESSALPSFWHGNPKLWFKQAEIIMTTSRLSNDETRFNHIIKHLTETQCNLISDIILNPPLTDKYNVLKKTLIARSEESEMRRIQSVLHAVEMGNHSPSSFHRQLVRMAGDSNALSSELIKKLWISRLPSTIGAIMLGMENDDIAKLYETADRIWGMNNPITNPFCNSYDASHNVSNHNNSMNAIASTSNFQSFDVQELIRSINELKTRFDRFESRSNSNNNFHRNRSRSRGSNSRSNSTNRTMCWYHYKYGEKAMKCNKTDCSYKSKKSSEN